MGKALHDLVQSHLGFWLIRLVTNAVFGVCVLTTMYWLVSKMSPGAKQFWLGVMSDSGQPSWSRVASSIIVLFGCIWTTFLVYVNHVMPDVSGLALLIGVPYGLNVIGKSATMIANRKGVETSTTTVLGDVTGMNSGTVTAPKQ
jgi:hypothetical protein